MEIFIYLSNLCLAATVNSSANWLPHQAGGEDRLNNKLRMVVICCLLHCQLKEHMSTVIKDYLIQYLQGTQLHIELSVGASPCDRVKDTVIWPNSLEGQNDVPWTECSPDTVTCQLECPIHGEED